MAFSRISAERESPPQLLLRQAVNYRPHKTGARASGTELDSPVDLLLAQLGWLYKIFAAEQKSPAQMKDCCSSLTADEERALLAET